MSNFGTHFKSPSNLQISFLESMESIQSESKNLEESFCKVLGLKGRSCVIL